MRYAELRDALQIRDGMVAVSAAGLTGNLDDLWLRCFGGQPVVITGAAPGPDDDQQETVVIQGRSTYLGVLNAAVELRARVDAGGQAQVKFRFTLLGENPGLADWKFSRSFPSLPTVIDWSKTLADPPAIPLNDLLLFDAAYVVVSEPEPAAAAPLQRGINFVSRLRPTGAVGIIESVFGVTEPLTLFGTITLPLETDRTVPLQPQQYPWDLEAPPPGILLEAPLGLDLAIAGLQFGNAKLRFYWPHSQAWLDKNPTFRPLMAYAGQLSVPSAGLSLDVVAPTEPGTSELLLLGHFEGVSLGKLAELADVVGTGDLISAMPDEIQQMGDALGRLELTHAAISLGLAYPRGFTVGMTSVTIGIPDLHWQVWKDHFAVDSIECRFTMLNPFSVDPMKKPKLEVMLLGTMAVEGVPVRVRAGSQDRFTVHAELAEQQTIPLSKLWPPETPKAPDVGDLTVNAFAVTVAPFRQYAYALALAGQPEPWVIDVGKTKLTVADVVLAFAYPPFAGTFGGAISFGKTATLTIRWDLPGDIMIKGFFPAVKLSEILEAMVSDSVAMPGDFDLDFINSSVVIQKVGQNYLFRVGTTVGDVGVFAMEVRRTSGTGWGFAAGIDLSGGLASGLPGLGPLKAVEEYFRLQKLLLVLSTFADTSFTFPDLAQFNNPVIAGGRLSLPGKGGVVAGLNLYANWVIDTGDKQQKLLKELLGLDPSIAVTVQVGPNPAEETRVYVGYDTKINGMPFVCKFGGQLSAGSVGLFLEGALTVKIQGQPQTFDVKLDFVENGAFISSTMKGSTPIDFEVFKIGNLALAIGVSWECIPSLGIAGTLDVGSFDSSVAIFFDAVEPQKSMVAGAVSDLSLKDVLETLVGDVAPSQVDAVLEQIGIVGTHSFEVDGALAGALDQMQLDQVASAFAAHGVSIPSSLDSVYFVVAEPGKSWFLTDLKNQARHYQLKQDPGTGKIKVSLEAQFYCAPQRTQIGALPPFDAGYFIAGGLNVAGFHTESTIEINPRKGIAVESAMSRVVIYDENLFSLTSLDGTTGPLLSIATFTQPDQAVPEFRPPHVCINSKLRLLGLDEHTFISLTTKGLEFDLGGNVNPLLYIDLHGHIGGPTSLGVGGEVKLGIGDVDLGALGKVPVKTGVDGKLDLGVEGAKAYAKVSGSFDFAGSRLGIGEIELNVKTGKLLDLPEQGYKAVKQALEALLTDAEAWANYVAKGFITGVDDVEQVLQQAWGKTADEAKQIYNKAYGVTQEVCSVTTAALRL